MFYKICVYFVQKSRYGRLIKPVTQQCYLGHKSSASCMFWVSGWPTTITAITICVNSWLSQLQAIQIAFMINICNLPLLNTNRWRCFFVIRIDYRFNKQLQSIWVDILIFILKKYGWNKVFKPSVGYCFEMNKLKITFLQSIVGPW